MWVWRRMEKVHTNEEGLDTVGEERKLLEEIRKRQSRWLDQGMIGEWILKAIIEVRTLGKAGRGRKRRRFQMG
jgi:hypothetical protein